MIDSNIFCDFKAKLKNKVYQYITINKLNNFSFLNKLFIFLTQIPMVCEPIPWNKKNTLGGYLLNSRKLKTTLVKLLKKGHSSFNISDNTLETLNILQKKAYTIDCGYLNILKQPLFKINNNIPSAKYLHKLYLELHKQLKNLKAMIPTNYYTYVGFRTLLYNSSEYKESDIKTKIFLLNELKAKFNISEDFIDNLSNLKNFEKHFLSQWLIYLNHSYFITLADAFNITLTQGKLCFYIVNTLDFRGRIYPSGRLHRASGIYKGLFKQKELYKYTKEGLQQLKLSLVANFGRSFKTID